MHLSFMLQDHVVVAFVLELSYMGHATPSSVGVHVVGILSHAQEFCHNRARSGNRTQDHQRTKLVFYH